MNGITLTERLATERLALVSGLYTRGDWFSSSAGFQKLIVETVRLMLTAGSHR